MGAKAKTFESRWSAYVFQRAEEELFTQQTSVVGCCAKPSECLGDSRHVTSNQRTSHSGRQPGWESAKGVARKRGCGPPGLGDAAPLCGSTAADRLGRRPERAERGRPPTTGTRARGKAGKLVRRRRGGSRAQPSRGGAPPLPVGHSCRHAQHLSAVACAPSARRPLAPLRPPSPPSRCGRLRAGGPRAGRGGQQGAERPPPPPALSRQIARRAARGRARDRGEARWAQGRSCRRGKPCLGPALSPPLPSLCTVTGQIGNPSIHCPSPSGPAPTPPPRLCPAQSPHQPRPAPLKRPRPRPLVVSPLPPHPPNSGTLQRPYPGGGDKGSTARRRFPRNPGLGLRRVYRDWPLPLLLGDCVASRERREQPIFSFSETPLIRQG